MLPTGKTEKVDYRCSFLKINNKSLETDIIPYLNLTHLLRRRFKMLTKVVYFFLHDPHDIIFLFLKDIKYNSNPPGIVFVILKYKRCDKL